MTDFERYIKKCDLSLKDDVVITKPIATVTI